MDITIPDSVVTTVGRHCVIVTGSEFRTISGQTFKFSPGVIGTWSATFIVNADLTLQLELHVQLS